ncbi:MAG TPA: nucleotidyl transferase [Chloroflexus aurantiacus]|uniref:Nucleotidyl transferase n=1 Tax=Chloroflexus aurantiacus (strain ATCC 29366 / DSM 635 / J-10-fl) TaxID=324602 RepID=A9WAE2_CHLAA|nr:sugar transferase [Chloroflexus aurantiacus]ABY34701.1 Nucleotidyl transferase [Chloroflexus aurantiacus J-10-fl]HBW67339.1 nucleotidyl transferase [Chloroflexus aurantiacus]
MTIAFIIATAEERRLAPLTDVAPDVLLPIVDRPVMATTIEILARAGIKRILIALHEQSAPITAVFGSGRRWGVDIEYVSLNEAWADGGALRWAAPLIHETCLVIPGNAIIDVAIEAALDHHQRQGALLTAITHQPHPHQATPYAVVAADGQIGAVLETPTGADVVALTGAYIVEPALIEHIPLRSRCVIATDLLPRLIAGQTPVQNFTFSGYWNPLTTLTDYYAAQQVFLYSAYRALDPNLTDGPADTVRYPSLSGRKIAPGIWVGRNDSIHPSVRIAPPLYIGDNCWIGREAELGTGTVIGSGCMVDDEATVTASIVWSDTYVGQLVNLNQRIVYPGMIVDPDTGEQTAIVDAFLIGRVSAVTASVGRFASFLNRLAALLLLILLSPLFLLTGILAALGSGGRPLVGVARIGERIILPDGHMTLRPFTLWRWHTRHADGRYRWFGRWLETYELHRLPELLSVLRGDLQLVGVKPLTPNEAALLNEEWQQRRHDVPPGVTGLWYVQASSDDLDTVIIADVYYSATRSWRRDLDLLVRTPVAWLRRVTKAHQTVRSSLTPDLTLPPNR